MRPDKLSTQSVGDVAARDVAVAKAEELLQIVEPLVPSLPPSGAARHRTFGASWRMKIVVLVGVLSLLCFGGLGYAFSVYNRATKPNRSSPDVVVDNYLQAVLVDRSAASASKYSCPGAAAQLKPFIQFRDGFVSREAGLGGQVSFSWGPLHLNRDSDGTTVAVEITVDTSGGSTLAGRSLHEWSFTAVEDDEWFVCAASPTA
jgi:hypothetical protein